MFARTLRLSLTSSSRSFSSSPRSFQIFSEANEATFGTHVRQRTDDKVVLVDFFAPWCAPCKMLKPILTRVSESNDVDLVTVDIDEIESLGQEFQIRNLPTVMAFKNGVVVDKFMGMKPEKAIVEFVNGAKSK